MLPKPRLFESQREFLLFVLVMLLLLLGRLGWEYYHYRQFIAKPFYYTHAIVLNAYEKHKGRRTYTVLKLQSDEGLRFYTTTHSKQALDHSYLRLQIFPDARIRFWEYLGTFYVKSRIKEYKALPETMQERLGKWIAKQHSDSRMGAFYNAIFLALPLPQTLREPIAALGVSHLVALSGFHLSILWGLLYGLLVLPYRALQQRYFPYRYALIDVGMVVMVLLGIYVWFVGAPPSLLRSYAMVLVGWVVLLLGLELMSFTFLAAVFAILTVLFPSLLVSLSFWLSVAGVFYIFLLLQYTKGLHPWLIMLLVIPVGIFILMLPIVHGIFGMTTSYQLLSPILSLLFIPFYPVSFFLHLIGMGDLFDPALQRLFALPKESSEILLPWWIVVGYVGLSMGAVRYRALFYLTLLFAALYALFLFIV